MTAKLPVTATLYAATPADYAGEKNDCVVRALSLAANAPYPRAHALLLRAGRKARHGAPWNTMYRAAPILGGVRVNSPRVTLAAFLAAHPGGRFMVVRRGHAFAVLDGVVHDWAIGHTAPRSRIIAAWMFPGAQHRPNGLQSPA